MRDYTKTTQPMEPHRDLTMSPERATLLGIPLSVAAVALVLVPFRLIWGGNGITSALDLVDIWMLLVVLIASIVVHEALHGLTWYFLGGRPRPVIKYGVNWKALMPYAHATTPMSARAYRLGALAPGLLMGIVPAAVALLAGHAATAGWAALFLAFAVGDFMVIYTLRGVPPTTLVRDHPSRVGCEVV
jgi:hypothetical protein